MVGLERADSITIDPQKWFFEACDIGALLVRDGSLLEPTFLHRPEHDVRVAELLAREIARSTDFDACPAEPGCVPASSRTWPRRPTRRSS